MIIELLLSKHTKPTRMALTKDHDEDSPLCCRCVSDQFLSEKIEAEGVEDECSFCDFYGKTLLLGEIAEMVEVAFNEHFERTSNEPSDWDYLRMKVSDGFWWDRVGEPVVNVIAEVAGVEDHIADAIWEILRERNADFEAAKSGEESEFARDSHYVPKPCTGYNQLHDEWALFEHQLQTESRFLNPSFQGALERVFEGIEDFQTREGHSVIETIGPGTDTTTLFRARVFQTVESLTNGLCRPDREIGPPPIGKAAAGRMNASGISVFYGALAPLTAIAEVRPPVGSDVVVATFEILRPLRVLNLSALMQIMVRKSYFDPDCRPLQERVAFLEILGNKMTRPVMPEREHADYLVTQVIADFLASEHGLDGILYPSVQVAADRPVAHRTNIVLFHRTSRVEEIELPKGTALSASHRQYDDEGENSEFVVYEELQAQCPPPVQTPNEPFGLNLDPEVIVIPERFPDKRQASLRLVVEAVSVHHVDAVHFSTTEFPVKRHRIENFNED